MRLKEVTVSESIQLHDGHWKKFGAITELDAGDDENVAWAKTVNSIEGAKRKYLNALPSENTDPEAVIEEDKIIDNELEKAKSDLEAIEFQEDALTYLKDNGWTYTIVLKNIANSKPKKLTEQ